MARLAADIDASTVTSSLSRLAAFERGGGATADILGLYDDLPPVSVEAILGRWRGSGVSSGHPMDGLLDRFGWYGKAFDGPDNVHPLLCRTAGGRIFALNPTFVPLGLVARHTKLFHTRLSGAVFALAGRAAATRRPTARLCMTEFRGVVTATMIYDSLPIRDIFRSASSDTLLGVMDMRGMEQPFFFALRRDDQSP